jgi:predicted amidohydrolase YtcJ
MSRDRQGRRWRGGLVKLFLDGVIHTGTGWLYEPDPLGSGLKSFWPHPADYAPTVRQYGAARFQVATYAIGDRAIGAAIDAYVAAGAQSWRGAPHRIEHLECLADRDVARLAAAGITATAADELLALVDHELHRRAHAQQRERTYGSSPGAF